MTGSLAKVSLAKVITRGASRPLGTAPRTWAPAWVPSAVWARPRDTALSDALLRAATHSSSGAIWQACISASPTLPKTTTNRRATSSTTTPAIAADGDHSYRNSAPGRENHTLAQSNLIGGF